MSFCNLFMELPHVNNACISVLCRVLSDSAVIINYL